MNKLPLLFLSILCGILQAQDSIPVIVSNTMFAGSTISEEMHFRITQVPANIIVYDTIEFVPVVGEFRDTLYLDSGYYRADVSVDANTYMPTIVLDNGDTVSWGYPNHEFYFFALPGKNGFSYGVEEVIECEEYISPSGNYTWDSTGTYVDTLSNVLGADSIVVIDLIVPEIDTGVTVTNYYLESHAEDYYQNFNFFDVSYNWINCTTGNDNFNSNQSHMPPANSSDEFAVEVFLLGCSSMSDCYQLDSSAFNDVLDKELVLWNIYPNPAQSLLEIKLNQANNAQVQIYNGLGEVVMVKMFSGESTFIDISSLADGVLYVELITPKGVQRKTIIKSS